MPLQQQIETIITKRRMNQGEFVSYYEKTSAIYDFVNGVKSFKSNPGWLTMINENEKLRLEWETLIADVNELELLLKDLSYGDTGCLIECLKRVKREYLNIGCIGPWRQGKSTVISKLTNLSDYIIPRSKYLTCTGTTINVFNGNQVVWENNQYVEKDGNKAVLYFHSFNSICKTINEYLVQLGFSPMPYALTIESFVQNCSKCYKENSYKAGNDTELKKMLDKYLVHASEYAPLLKQKDGLSEEILNLSSIESQQKLRPYVSYYEKTDAEYELEGITTPVQKFIVLAVKKVDIFTHFLVNGENGPEEVGRIQFVDTPGIGESKLEVAETLANALRSDLDIAICLRKVSNQSGIIPTDSSDFHKVLKQNTFGRNPENWVFYLYNKEGDVAHDILMTTFSEVNGDLMNTPVQGRNVNQIIPGIKLKYTPQEPKGNHIDFIDVQREEEKLQKYFLSILTEMATTISVSDNAFYNETRDLYNKVSNLYQNIIGGSMKTISQCLPTFDDREKILKTIKAVNNMWMANVKCPETLSENINAALVDFYKEPYGVVLAEVLGLSPEKIKKMSDEIKKVENSAELKIGERIAKRKQIAYDAIFPLIQNKITSFTVDVLAVHSVFGEVSEKLSNRMSERAVRIIEATDAIKKLDDLKENFWLGFMNEGLLGFGKTDVNSWINYFLSLLEEGGADFAALHNAIVNFKNCQFDIRGDISKFVKATIEEVRKKFVILQGKGNDLKDIQESVYNGLISCEAETKAAVQSQCREAVNGQLLFALKNFNDEVIHFGMTIIPARKHILDYECEFEQLVKFYNKYSSEIFLADEQASQKLAVQEWNVLKLKHVN
ncbi:MAG: hypothetical protein IJE18_08580 [Bacteroidaceae bacterium]|nr:hypothetical protein [Bacteroidaceae bacterium]